MLGDGIAIILMDIVNRTYNYGKENSKILLILIDFLVNIYNARGIKPFGIFYLQGHYVTFKPMENFCIIVI